MSWVPSYDTSFYFDPLSDPPKETNLTTIPALRQVGGHAVVSRSRLSQSQPEQAPHYALATEARMQQTSQVPSSGGTSFSLHFTKDRKGAHFGEPPRATKPKVDFSKTERPWEPKGGISPEQYTSRRMQYVVKKHTVSKIGAARRRSVPLLTPSATPIPLFSPLLQSISPKSALSFGSTTPRSLAMGKATYKGNHVPITIADYSDRAPPPLHSPIYAKDGVSPKSRSGGYGGPSQSSRQSSSPTRSSPPARTRQDSSMDFFDRFSSNPSRWSASQTPPTLSNNSHFIADFEFIQKNRERKREKARMMAAKFGGSEEDYLGGEGRLKGGATMASRTPRFYALAKALWLAIIVETTQTNVKSLRNYLQVLQWRAGGQIDEVRRD